MSYVRFNDRHDDGQITQFRERLSAEVRAQTGEAFPIFQDRNDVAWGQNWQARIEEALDAVTLLIPIITPSFFRSQPCRDELTRFLARERELDQQDRILPVYYIGTPEFDELDRRDADELALVLASRQYADWRELRFEPFTSPVVRKAVAQLASRMRDTFWHPSARPGRSMPERGLTDDVEATSTRLTAGFAPAAKTEPPTRVVDAYQRGDFTSIGAAIAAAHPGDRILVRPGLYQEGLEIDKPLEILGMGAVEDVEVQARDTPALVFRTNIGRVANLTLRQAGGEELWVGVDITQGRLELEGCDISSQALAGVAISNGADPRLRRNRIHDSKDGAGVVVYDDGLGMLEDNEITANRYSGVEIQAGGNPTLRRNQIHHNDGAGVFALNDGLGTLEDNVITANGLAGVVIRTGGDPVLRRNQIDNNHASGVRVYNGGRGTLEDNDITGNGLAGVAIETDGDPTLRRNRINRNQEAVWISGGGRGVIEDNDLTDNRKGPWNLASSAESVVKRSNNRA